MKYTFGGILLLMTIGILIFTFDKGKIEEKNVELKQLENVIEEPKFYGKLGEIYIEISATSGSKRDDNINLTGILANLYGKDNELLMNLLTNDGTFDSAAKTLTIDEELIAKGRNFKLKAESCRFKIDGNIAVFHKPTIEFL
jgi:hypothetical protein